MSRNRALKEAREFSRLAQQVFPDSEVYLFGSYAKGTQHVGSDIDVCIVLDTFDGETAASVFEKQGILQQYVFDHDSMIEPTITSRNDHTGFLRIVLQTGIRVA